MPGNNQYLPQQWPAFFFAALDDPQLASQWQVAGSADIATCLAVYRNNTRGGRVRALEITYPVVQQLLGHESFEGFANRYTLQHPAQQADLDRFGHDFAAFLRQQSDLSGYDYIAAMAELEWMIQTSRQAVLSRPLRGLDLQQLDDSRLARFQVRRSSSVQLCRSDYNLHELWLWHQQPEGEPQLEQGNYHIAIYMRWSESGWHLAMARLSTSQHTILEHLQQPCLLNGVCEQISGYAGDLSQELNYWLLQGWLEAAYD